MADCRRQVYSNDYFDFIVTYGELSDVPVSGACTQRISEEFDIFYYPRAGLPELAVGKYTYTSIPKCFGLQESDALEASGIIRLQNQPVLALKGSGVLVGFVDTGIDYTNKLFRYADGSSRIAAIWDQTIEDGTPPAGIIYGAEYTTEDINRALGSENPYEVVPSRDENGHGTFLAGVACGGEDIPNNFIGAVPESQIAVVRLKEAKQYLKDFYFVRDGVPVFQENDIMMAVSYLNSLANIKNMPLVICLALGNSMGSHGKTGALTGWLNLVGTRRRRCIVTPAGNEANARHHFQGQIGAGTEYEDAEISVEDEMDGFIVELWAEAPELFAVSVISPTGQQFPRIPVRVGASEVFNFVFEGTTVTVDYRLDAKETASQLIHFRFTKPRKGLWIIRVFPESTVQGLYNMWMQLQQLMMGNVFFLRSSPDITVTAPGMSSQVITVGGDNASNQSIFADSGRGYTVTGEVKPDFVAPAVGVYGPGLRDNYVTYAGTSASAAITAGACAQVMQWAIVDQNNPLMTSAGIKNMLIRGTRKSNDRSYPNREWGYGMLDVYQAFDMLRR